MNYTIISGTNRPDSNSLILANYYKKKFSEKNVNCEIVDLKDLPNDFTTSNMYGKRTDEFQKTQDVISKSDKLFFVIAEYNGSFPGVLKAFIDSCDFPESFAGKKCGMVGLSAGKFGNLRGLEHFTGVANYIKMDVYHNKMYLPGIENDINDDGEINTPQHVALIESQIEGFINF